MLAHLGGSQMTLKTKRIDAIEGRTRLRDETKETLDVVAAPYVLLATTAGPVTIP